jgi:hypothetical protein
VSFPRPVSCVIQQTFGGARYASNVFANVAKNSCGAAGLPLEYPNISSRPPHDASRQMTPPQDATPFDSSTAPKTLSATSIGALRLWLQTQRSGVMSGRPIRHGDVQRAMRLVCNEVRRRGLPVERLIILLKEQWFTLTEEGDGGSLKSRDALEEIIRTCIDEFYASASSASASLTQNGNASEVSR